MTQYGAAVTDPALLSQLESGSGSNLSVKYGPPVSDPALLNQLNGDENVPSNNQNNQNNQPKGFLGKWWNAIKTMNHDPYELGAKILKGTPGFLASASSELIGNQVQQFTEPTRQFKNLVTGVGEARNALVNIPSDILKYYAHLGLIDPKYADMIRAKENLTQMIDPNEPEHAGDVLTRAIPGLAMGGTPIIRGLEKVAKTGLGAVTEPFTGAGRLAPLKEQLSTVTEEQKAASQAEAEAKSKAKVTTGYNNWETLENKKNEAKAQLDKLTNDSQQNYVDPNELQQARNNFTQADTAYEQAKAASEGNINVSNPFKIQNKIDAAKSNLDNLKKILSENPPKTLDEFNHAKVKLENAKNEYAQAKSLSKQKIATSEPDTIQYNINNNEAKINQVNQDLGAIPENQPVDLNKSQENLSNANESHEQAKQNTVNAENAITQHLNPSADYKMRVSRELNHRIKSIYNFFSESYKNMMNKLKANKFELGNASRLDRIDEESAKARAEFGDDPEGEFARIIKLAPSAKDTQASDYMNHQKDFRDAIHNLYKEAAREGREGSSVRAAELFRVAKGLKPFEDLVNETLREGLGEHLYTYDTLQRGYREQVRPLRENATANKITEGKPMSADIASELSGDHIGQPLLRELAKQNPEILRNIMGQQDIKDVLNPNELLREYTNEMPELNRLVSMQNRALNSQNNAKNTLDNANLVHENNIQLNKENEQNQEYINKRTFERNKLTEKTNLMKEFKENIEKKQKNMNAAQIEHDNLARVNEQHEKVINDIKNLEEKLPVLENHLSEILKKSSEKEKTEAEFKNLSSKQKKFEKTNVAFENQKNDLEKIINEADQHSRELQELQKTKNISQEKLAKIKKDIKTINKKVIKARVILGVVSSSFLPYAAIRSFRYLTSGYNQGEQ